MTVAEPPHIQIRRHSDPSTPMTYSEYDLEMERRVSRLETTVDDIKKVIDAARPQLAIITILGSMGGSVVVAVVVWLITTGK
jgi:hypothetical protein